MSGSSVPVPRVLAGSLGWTPGRSILFWPQMVCEEQVLSQRWTVVPPVVPPNQQALCIHCHLGN